MVLGVCYDNNNSIMNAKFGLLSINKLPRKNTKRETSAEYCNEGDIKKPSCETNRLPLNEEKYCFYPQNVIQLPLTRIYASFDQSFAISGMGIIIDEPYVIQLEWKNSMVNGLVLVANKDTNHFVGVYNVDNNIIIEKKDLHACKESTLSLSSSGERWEGECIDDTPCGWGCFYDENNYLYYQGFRFRDKAVCYGTTYYPSGDSIEYSGTFCNSLYCGFGTLFDKKGVLLNQGEWINGHTAERNNVTVPPGQCCTIDSLINKLVFADYSGGYLNSLHLSNMWLLTSITIGHYCMASIGGFGDLSFSIEGLPQLQSISIGSASCIQYRRIVLNSKLENGIR